MRQKVLIFTHSPRLEFRILNKQIERLGYDCYSIIYLPESNSVNIFYNNALKHTSSDAIKPNINPASSEKLKELVKEVLEDSFNVETSIHLIFESNFLFRGQDVDSYQYFEESFSSRNFKTTTLFAGAFGDISAEGSLYYQDILKTYENRNFFFADKSSRDLNIYRQSTLRKINNPIKFYY